MANLLDRVLSNKDNPSADQLLSPTNDNPHQLPDGSIIYDSTVAAINRILALNPHLHKRKTGIRSEPYQLYNGHTPVDLTNRKTFLSLLKADFFPRTPFQTTFLVNKVIELAPLLTKDCVVVSEGLIWDREAGRLRKIRKNENIRTVS